MNYLLAENLSKSFGDKQLFSNLTFGIEKGNKIALISKNGAGKTSLLEILAGTEEADEGKVILRNGIHIAYLRQEPSFPENATVFDALFQSSDAMVSAVRDYEKAMLHHYLADSPQQQRLLDEATQQMDRLQAWDYESRMKEILGKLQITNIEQNVSELSGGQRKKLAMASVLIQQADILLLDEPTNHLDIVMIEWLEDFLSSSNLSILVVTHDRYFLDNVCDTVLELDNGEIYRYQGNYTYFVEKKAERLELQDVEQQKMKSLYEKELDWIRRMPKARTTKSKARISSFDHIKEAASKRVEKDLPSLKVEYNRIGGKIMEIHNLHKKFDKLNIVDDFTYTFKRGERIGIVGRNGTGKSTLLHLLEGKLKPDAGRIVIGQTVVMGHYSQGGLQASPDKRVIDIVKDVAEVIRMENKSEISASQFLRQFGFNYQMQMNYFGNLSGGEKRRLFLLLTLMKNPNFLMLDEPANDLDIYTLNILEEFLLDYKGCLVIVSHDRFFMDKLVDHLFIFEGEGKIKDFYGNYTQYRAHSDKLLAEARKKAKLLSDDKPKQKSEGQKKLKPTFKQVKEFETLEKEINDLESEKEEIGTKMSNSTYNNQELITASKRLTEIIGLIEEKSMMWLELGEIME